MLESNFYLYCLGLNLFLVKILNSSKLKLASQEGSEETVMRYMFEQGKVEVDVHKTSLKKELMENFYNEQKLQKGDLNFH